MSALKFDKKRAAEIIDALASGRPIQPASEQGWTSNDLLMWPVPVTLV